MRPDRGTPTWAAGIAAAPFGASSRPKVPGGVYHWTDLGMASWYDFAVAIQDEAVARGLLRPGRCPSCPF